MIWQLLVRVHPVFPQEGCESRCVTTLNTITAAAIVPATLNHGGCWSSEDVKEASN